MKNRTRLELVRTAQRCEETIPFPEDRVTVTEEDYADIEDEVLERAIHDLEVAHKNWRAAKARRKVKRWDSATRRLV